MDHHSTRYSPVRDDRDGQDEETGLTGFADNVNLQRRLRSDHIRASVERVARAVVDDLSVGVRHGRPRMQLDVPMFNMPFTV